MTDIVLPASLRDVEPVRSIRTPARLEYEFTAGAATSLITLYALTRFWNMAFWRGRDELEGYESVLLGSVQEAPEGATVTATRTTPVLMVAATTTLVVVTVLLTVFAGPLFELTDRASLDLVDPESYVSLVFPRGIR